MGKRKSDETFHAEVAAMHDFQLLEQMELAETKLDEARERALTARATQGQNSNLFRSEHGLYMNRLRTVRAMRAEFERRRNLFRKGT